MAVVVNGHYEVSGHYGLRVAWASMVTCDLHLSSSVSYDLIPITDYLMSIAYYLIAIAYNLTSIAYYLIPIADYLTSIAETQRGWPRGAIPLFGFPEDSALRRNPPLRFVCLGFVCLGSVSRVQAAFRSDRSL